MNIEFKTHIPTTNTSGTILETNFNGFRAKVVAFYTDNCKLSHFRNVGSWLGHNESFEKEKIAIFTEMCKHADDTIFMTLNDIESVNFLRKNFDVLYAIKMPIGYGKNFQYHICVKNPQKDRYNERIKNERIINLKRRLKKYSKPKQEKIIKMPKGKHKVAIGKKPLPFSL